MGIEEMFKAMSTGMRNTRTAYHLTLGEAIEHLETLNPNHRVTFDYDENMSPSDPHSYRGYYEDLALEPAEYQCHVSGLLGMLQDALGETFMGYKGGDFVMDEDTPLWCSEYGTTGRAITGLRLEGRGVVLDTKDITDD